METRAKRRAEEEMYPMLLTKLLEIDESRVPPEARRSILLAERIWREAGEPEERWKLTRLLEEILLRCIASGIWYAPILLQRKKAIERGTWLPQPRRKTAEASGTTPALLAMPCAPAHPALTALLTKRPPASFATLAESSAKQEPPPARECPVCHGTAVRIHPDGRRGLCVMCDAWLEKGLPPGYPDL